MYNVIIIGGEKMGNYPFFEQKTINCIKNRAKTEGVTIFTTGDKLVETFTNKYGITSKIFYTDWKSYGKDALKRRNEEMLREANAIITFEDELKDSHMLTKMATEKGLPHRYFILP